MFLVAEAYALRAGPARLARRRLGALRPLASAPPAAAEWTVPRVRDTFVDYFAEKRGHTRVPSSGVVPLQDPTLLFANAGMNQFKPIFLGQAAPGTQLATLERACNSQKCIRAGGKHNDLEDVGLDTYHHTFFEMLGSWSFGDYFKAEATAWAKELLVDVYGLDMDRMYATYFEGSPEEGLEPDYEARDLWLAAASSRSRSSRLQGGQLLGDGRLAPAGPARSSTTTRWGRGDVAHLVNMDDPTVIEIWNLVFIQFERDGKTKRLSSLPAQHVDTGLGLERLVAILNQVPSNYDTDAFSGLFAATLAELPEGSAPYGGLLGDDDKAQNYRDTAYRAIADHVRCLSFAIADGARPSNEGRGYVLRRILRRAVRYGLSTLGAEPGFMARLAPALAASHFGDYYPELREELPTIVEVLAEEEATFAKTLERGVKYLDEELDKLEATDVLGGDAAFFLYDSLGFPVDLTAQMAEERGFLVDEPGFEAAMRAQVDRSKADRKARAEAALGTVRLELGVAATAALGDAGVAPTDALAVGATVADDATEASDRGSLVLGGASVDVIDVQAYAGYVVHTVASGADVALAVGDAADGVVDGDARRKHAVNHMMTHAVNHALWAELGDGVGQRGSDANDERLRFDFSHGKALKAAQLAAVEAAVNTEYVADGATVERAKVGLEDAKNIRALRAVFGEAYPEPVNVVAMFPKAAFAGAPTIADVLASPDDEKWDKASIELCGGNHLGDAAAAEYFVITQETAVAKGVRRIEALTGAAALEARAAGARLERAAASSPRPRRLTALPRATPPRAKALSVDVDATPCAASLKPDLRAALEGVAKALGAFDKQVAGEAAGRSSSRRRATPRTRGGPPRARAALGARRQGRAEARGEIGQEPPGARALRFEPRRRQAPRLRGRARGPRHRLGVRLAQGGPRAPRRPRRRQAQLRPGSAPAAEAASVEVALEAARAF
ncbi:hypothetical protein JL722_6842 [Aureococcus anophagefferens]|nr:hypothetical protein JL722_6842 [Aureococcus anophagefferens]